MEEKKKIKISLSTFLLILALIVIVIMGVCIYILYNNKVNEIKNTNSNTLQATNTISNTTNTQVTNTTQTNTVNTTATPTAEPQSNSEPTAEPSNSNNSAVDFDDYIGGWYESEEIKNKSNPTNLSIKNVSGDTILMDMYVTRIGSFYDLEATMNGNSGTYEGYIDPGLKTSGEREKISGKITFTNNSIKLTVDESNVLDYDSGAQYTFTYCEKNETLENYKGRWFESEAHSNDSNPNYVEIKEIDGNKISFYFYFTRTAGFSDVEAYVTNGYGHFEAKSDQGMPPNGDKAEVSGSIVLKDDKVELHINGSNTEEIKPGRSLKLTYNK